jgi:hypothetical protein
VPSEAKTLHVRLDAKLVEEFQRFIDKSGLGLKTSSALRLLIAIALRDVAAIDQVWGATAWNEGFRNGQEAFFQSVRKGLAPDRQPPTPTEWKPPTP